MHALVMAVALITLILAYPPHSARAGCTADSRRVVIDKKNVVKLKTFNCSKGSETFRVEFHRFSEAVASLIVAKQATKIMRQTFGTPRLVENEVFRAYDDLLQKFGVTVQLELDPIYGPGGNVRVGLDGYLAVSEDKLPNQMIRRILGSEGTHFSDYPAVTEIAALRKKTIPGDLRFLYEAACLDKVPADSPVSGLDLSSVSMTFWRPLQREDMDNYAKNVTAFNSTLKQFESELRNKNLFEQSPLPQVELSNKLKFFKYLAGDTWPDDFLIIYGREEGPSGCSMMSMSDVDEWSKSPDLYKWWSFKHSGKRIFLDAVLIENTSKQPLRIGGLYGSKVSEPTLHRADQSKGQGDTPIATLSETLAPGQRILVPLKIHLEDDPFPLLSGTPKQSKSIFDRVGLNGFKGNNTGHAFPTLPAYSYGPELTVRAFLVNGSRVDLEQPRTNFADLSRSREVGSCPYLLSWDEDAREWIDHGKVLHKAPNRVREYTETRSLQGFVSHYRVEEREAEIAFVDQAELTVVLKTGGTAVLKPEDARLARRDGNYLPLPWGASTGVHFVLPKEIVEDDIAESRFAITGYYERYPDLRAQEGTVDQTVNLDR